MLATVSAPKVKGVAFRSVCHAVRGLRGEAFFDGALQLMEPEVGVALAGNGIVARGWYPIDWYREMWRAVDEAGGEGRSFAREVGKVCVRNDLTGVYRVVLKVLSPHTVFNASPRLFASYYDTGTVEILESRRGYTHALWSGCVGFSQSMWDEMHGASEAILEGAGAKNVRFRALSGGGLGDERFEAEAEWEI
jgi:hypothetical protein